MELTPRGADIVKGVVPADYEPPQSGNQAKITAFAFFLSLDLAGSTALKTRDDSWAQVITYFYGQAVAEAQDAAPELRVWKYIGDEVTFNGYVSDLAQLQHWVSVGFRTQRAVLDALNAKFPTTKGRISIKGISWIAPVTGYAEIALGAEPATLQRLHDAANELKTQDILFRDARSNVDFIGPSIDAGFRLAKFTRPLQLAVSPALAYYYLKGAKRTNDLRVVGFESLKGVAKGELYPAVWYHENWEGADGDFGYADRFTDELVQRVAAGRYESIEVLDEVRLAFDDDYYFFDIERLQTLVTLAAPFVQYLP